MMARAVLAATLLTLVAFSFAPTASAAVPCVVGDQPQSCAVSVEMRVCVTEPCDEVDVCLLFGRVCPV